VAMQAINNDNNFLFNKLNDFLGSVSIIS